MNTFYLIRHGENDYVGQAIAGRTPGVHLNTTGRQQAEELARHLAREPIAHLFSSPMERAQETAAPLARELHLDVRISAPLIEIDFGDWTGKSFAELDAREDWRCWNAFRSAARAPQGESMLGVQARMVGEVERLRRQYPDQGIALFSHGDPLRCILLYYLGLPLDLFGRLELSTASVTVLTLSDWTARFQRINWVAARPGLHPGLV